MLRSCVLVLTIGSLMNLSAAAAEAQTQKRTGSYEEMFERYLSEARQVGAASAAGSNWGWMDGLMLDRRARAVNDLITIRVSESIAGSGTADAATSKESDAAIAVPKFFGLETKLPGPMDPGALAALDTKTNFKGGGTTNRAGELTALITARVAEVLANGDLVVEGVREIGINEDRQIVVLTGVVRPSDVGPNNLVSSAVIGQMKIQYFGRGLMRDNLKPGWLVQILNKVF